MGTQVAGYLQNADGAKGSSFSLISTQAMELSFRPIAGGYSRQLQLINSSKDSSESFLVQEFSPGEMRRFPVDSCASIPNVSRELLDSGRASWRWQTVKSSPRGSGLSPLAGNLSARLRNRGKVSTMRCLGETVGVAAPVIRSDIEQCIASQAKQHRHHPSVSGTSSPRTHPSRGSSREARPSSQPPKEFLGTRLKKLRNTQKLDLVLAPVRNRGADTLELSFTDHRSGEEVRRTFVVLGGPCFCSDANFACRRLRTCIERKRLAITVLANLDFNLECVRLRCEFWLHGSIFVASSPASNIR